MLITFLAEQSGVGCEERKWVFSSLCRGCFAEISGPFGPTSTRRPANDDIGEMSCLHSKWPTRKSGRGTSFRRRKLIALRFHLPAAQTTPTHIGCHIRGYAGCNQPQNSFGRLSIPLNTFPCSIVTMWFQNPRWHRITLPFFKIIQDYCEDIFNDPSQPWRRKENVMVLQTSWRKLSFSKRMQNLHKTVLKLLRICNIIRCRSIREWKNILQIMEKMQEDVFF